MIFTGDVSTIISLAAALKFNGGGHINHSIFWQNLSADGGEPEGMYPAFLYVVMVEGRLVIVFNICILLLLFMK